MRPCGGFDRIFFTNKTANVSLSLVETQALPILKINGVEKTAQMIFSRLVVHTSTSESEKMENIEAEIFGGAIGMFKYGQQILNGGYDEKTMS